MEGDFVAIRKSWTRSYELENKHALALLDLSIKARAFRVDILPVVLSYKTNGSLLTPSEVCRMFAMSWANNFSKLYDDFVGIELSEPELRAWLDAVSNGVAINSTTALEQFTQGDN
jgi:hypothetical protein